MSAPTPPAKTLAAATAGAQGTMSRRGRLLSSFSLVFLYFLLAASVNEGIFAKWAFRDGSHRLSLTEVFDGTADRPFIYRQLVPALANVLDRVVPSRIKSLGGANKDLTRIFARARDSSNPAYEFRYLVVYAVCMLSLLGSLFVQQRLCMIVLQDKVVSTLAPAVFALCFPLFATVGSYYYDFSELFFLSSAVLLCVSSRTRWLPVLAIFAELNKETFVLLLPALYPILRQRFSRQATLAMLGISGAVATLVYLVISRHFAKNPGVSVELHLLYNLRYYFDPRSYLGFELTYGIPAPKGLSVFNIGLLFAAVFFGWKRLPAPFRQHMVIASIISVPLILAFAYGGELRNFSLLFPGLVILIGVAIREILSSQSRVVVVPSA